MNFDTDKNCHMCGKDRYKDNENDTEDNEFKTVEKNVETERGEYTKSQQI